MNSEYRNDIIYINEFTDAYYYHINDNNKQEIELRDSIIYSNEMNDAYNIDDLIDEFVNLNIKGNDEEFVIVENTPFCEPVWGQVVNKN